METYKRRKARWIISIFPSLFICLLFFSLPAANAETAAEYIEQGENQFSLLTVQGATDAYATFETAHSQYPNDPVINIYLALTRFCHLTFTDEAGGLKDLLGDYDISIEGTDMDTLDFTHPEDAEGDIVLPETSPTGEAVRSFIEGSLLTAINDSIANLDTAISNWTSTDKHIIAKEKFDTYADIEFDYGDIFLLRSALKSLKIFLLLITAYDLDVDIKEIVDLAQADLFNIQDSLDTYGDFLRMLPTSTTSGVDVEAQLSDARDALLGVIDDYLAASDFIRNDPGTEVGAEELIEIDECELLEDEFYRNNLMALKDSLTNNTVYEFVEDYETWLFDLDTGDQLKVELYDNKSDGYFDFTNCVSFPDYCWGGNVECVTIDNDQITLDLRNWYGDITFTGTLSTDGTEIAGGSFYGWYMGEEISGTFSGTRTNVEQETDRIDLNPLFGNETGPYDLRDFMPQFNEYNDPIAGTMAHGLGDDATLGGILPDMTQDDWGFEGSANTVLVGTWGLAAFVHLNEDIWFTEGSKYIFNSDRTVTKIYNYSYNGTLLSGVNYFTYTTTTNEDGSITFWYKEKGTGEIGSATCFISDDGKVMIMDGTDNTERRMLEVFVKIDTEKTYSNADLSGEYYTIGYERELSESEAYSGIFDFDGDGGFNATETINLDGTIETHLYSDTYSVNPDGSFVNYDIAGTGYLSGDGKIFINPNSECEDCWGGYIGIKKQDRSYSTADLEGTWAIVGFGDYEGMNIRATTGTMTFDSAGNCTYSIKIQRSDGSISYYTGSDYPMDPISVASDGSFGSSITSGAPAYAGAIGNDGNIFIMNRSFDQGNLNDREIIIGVRSSASQPNTPSNKATLSSPSNGATGVSLTVTLETGSFSDPDPGDTHAKTQWQISKETDFSSTVLDVTSSSNLTALTVPNLALLEGTTYYWRARFYDDSSDASDWADAYSFTTITTTNDQDGNGIPDDKQNNTVDLDGDGFSDIEQEDIKSMNTVVGNAQMGVSRRNEPAIVSIASIDSIDPDTISKVLRPGSMALGLFAIKVNVANAGDSAEVTIYFSNPAPSNAKWYMYNPIDRWVDYSGYATFSEDRKSVVLRLQDGGYGDADGVANGVIVDPGGFGMASWIEGLVSDSYTGEAITTGEVTIQDFVLDTALGGHFITAILPGTYSVTASASGYISKNYASVEVSEGSITTRNFVLSQSGGNLNIGWNLISLSKQPYESSISTVLSPIVNKYISVWAYVNGQWQVYDPKNPGFSDLTIMESGRGYWINMNKAATLSVSGSTPSKSRSLSSGWNLVGYDSSTEQAVVDALNSIQEKYISVWAYIDGGWKVYDPLNPGFSDLNIMKPGYGYWINAKEACTWTIP